MQLSVFPFTLALFLVGCSSPWQNLANSRTTSPGILVDSMTVSDHGELAGEVKTLEAVSCNGGSRYLEHPTSAGEFVCGKVKNIRVVYIARKSKPPTAEEVRKSMTKVWQGKFQASFCQIPWAEPTFWSIESILEFEDGRQGALITDGVHVALQNHDGKNWFFRLSPAAQ